MLRSKVSQKEMMVGIVNRVEFEKGNLREPDGRLRDESYKREDIVRD